jgi:peptidoglycan/xylan/chitin deacetylase (PgdA/CDA1 family)
MEQVGNPSEQRRGQLSDPRGEPRLSSWYDARLRRRLVLRVLTVFPQRILYAGRRATRSHGAGRRLLGEAVIWRETRATTSRAEWKRLTASSYTVLYYHRLKGDMKPGQERIDVSPRLFEKQMRQLRRFGFRCLPAEELVAFHDGSLATLPRRGVVITVDDGFADCVEPLIGQSKMHPQIFVVTSDVGGTAAWAGEERLADWAELQQMAEAGVGIGSHSRRHVALPTVADEQLRMELARSKQELDGKLERAIPCLAYPHGQRDPRVCDAALEAGFRLAFTTDPGRNGADTDRMQLRRIGIKEWDSSWSFLWKVVTGRLLPQWWENRRIRKVLPSYLPPQPTVLSSPSDGE